MTVLVIRPAKPTDAAGIARVEVDTWRDAYPDLLPEQYLTKTLDAPLCEARWERRIGRERSWRTLVALTSSAHRVAAYATAGPSRLTHLPHMAELFELYVHPDHQNQGIGRKLCAAIAERSLRNGHTSLCVEVLEGNANRFFYEALGGELAARRDHPFAGTTLPSCVYGWDDVRTLCRLATN